MRALFVGDVVGKTGLACTGTLLPRLKEEFSPSLTVVNGENAVGIGISREGARALLAAGADVVTTGNHAFSAPGSAELFESDERVLRPANFPPGTPGRGCAHVCVDGADVLVVNLVGRVFMENVCDCPFRVARALCDIHQPDVTLVDFHAEATSEKGALARFLDGRVAAVIGSHTHVQTSDEAVLAGGCAFISDLGMAGAADSVIGVAPEAFVARFVQGDSVPLRGVTGRGKVEGVVVEIEDGKAVSIQRFRRFDDDRREEGD